jgi:glutaredoxin
VSADLVCQLFYDPARQPGLVPPSSPGGRECEAVAIDGLPDGVERRARLERLGLAVPADLPAALVSGGDGRLRLLGVRLTGAEAAGLAAGEAWRPSEVVLYGTGWCSDCRLAKRLLGEAGVAFSDIDIESDAAAAATVMQRSGGRRVVPTLRLDGRLWAFNPEPALLRRLVAAASGGG